MCLAAKGSSLLPCCRAGSVPSVMSLLGELVTTSRLLDLNGCRSLCGIPASVTRKKDLAEALLLQARCPHKRRAVIRHLTDNMTANALRSWVSSLRRAGVVVPDSRVMGRGRAEIMDAIMRLECPAEEYSSAQGAEAQAASATGQAGGAEEYSSAQEVADSAGQSVGSHDVGMVMVAYDAGNSPEVSRRKWCKKWMKLARKAYMRSHLPGRVRNAVADALREYPDAMVSELREVVESKVGVDLCGKYGVLFDKALLRGTAKPEKPCRPRKRFVLAVGHRRAKQAPAS